MATDDVPGANPANKDVLSAGCWAEHSDGSLLYVKGTENQQVVYELYDTLHAPPVHYQDAMREEAFKKQFSYPPIGKSAEKWTWHDKTPFPWTRVMSALDRPMPQAADVVETLSAAARVAEVLRLRAHSTLKADVEGQQGSSATKGRAILDRLKDAFEAFVEG